MSRFFLSTEADADLDEIEAYFDSLPPAPATRGGEAIVRMLYSIVSFPDLGQPHSTLTRILGTQIRSRLARPYRIYYRCDGPAPEIIAILHTARDTQSLLAERFQ